MTLLSVKNYVYVLAGRAGLCPVSLLPLGYGISHTEGVATNVPINQRQTRVEQPLTRRTPCFRTGSNKTGKTAGGS